MPPRAGAMTMARWITKDAGLVSQIVEQILREEAWWVAARSKKFALSATIWVDGYNAEQRESRISRLGPTIQPPAREADG